MAGGKQTPRQAMIGMMYLVLLAMLAMNASKDLLNAFLFLENGIDVTTSNFDSGNKAVYDKIDEAAALGSKTAVDIKNKSTAIKKESEALYQKIQELKNEIVEASGGRDENGIPEQKDNQDIGAEYFISRGRGQELKDALAQYKSTLLNGVNEKDTALRASLGKLLDTPDGVDPEGVKVPWENEMSEHLPLAAVTANLTNLQSYIKNAELQVIQTMYEEISADALKVNKILATTIANNSYVLQGDEYRANVFLAAADTTQKPIILVGEYDTALYHQSGKLKFTGVVDSLPIDDGVGTYRLKADEVGNHVWGGIMKVPHPNPRKKGQFLTYPFESNYTVAAPSAVISSKDLNIMYKGYSNIMNISAPGMAADKIEVSADGCSTRKVKDGEYAVIPNRLGRTKVRVYANMGDGKKQLMGTQDWIVKSFPRPKLFIGRDEKPPKMKRNRLCAIRKITLKYSDDFPLSARPKVTKMRYELYDKDRNALITRTVRSDKFREDDLRRMCSIAPGAILYITAWGKGPDGKEQKIQEFGMMLKR